MRTDVVPEWVGPVCSPQYLRQKRIESVGDLARARLMASRTRPSAWDDWALCSSQANTQLRIDEFRQTVSGISLPAGQNHGRNRTKGVESQPLGRAAGAPQGADPCLGLQWMP